MFILIPHPGDHPMFKSYLTVGILSFLEYVMVITITLWRHFTQKPPRFPDDFKCKWKNPRPKFTRTTVHCNTNIYWFNVTSPIKTLFLDCNSDNSICHQSLIQPLSSKSSSVLLVEKLVPPHHWPQRSVHSVSPQRRSVTISAKLLVTGKDSKSQSSLPFKTDRLRYVKNYILIKNFHFWHIKWIKRRQWDGGSFWSPAKEVILTCRVWIHKNLFITNPVSEQFRSLLFHPPLQWSSRPSKNHHVTERRSRTVSKI